MRPGDIVKFKFNGRKRVFKVMSPDEVIEPGCICALGSETHDYSNTLNKFRGVDLAEVVFVESKLLGEPVKKYQNRLYLKPLLRPRR